MPDSSPLVACVIVTYKAKELTLDCVRSLLQSHGVRQRLIIVDNASQDGSAEFLRREIPGAEVITLAVNRGYTGGNNAGLRVARAMGASYAFVVNNDTLIDPDCVRRLVEEAERAPAIAMINPCIYYHDPSNLLWFGGSRFSLWTGRVVHVGRKRPFSAGFQTTRDIPFATGCAVLVRLKALEVFGELDESLFGYAEDLDWSLRARRAGFRLRYLPTAVLWHLEGTSYRRAGGQALRQYLSARNLLRVLARHAKWYQWITLLPVFLIDHVARFTALSLIHRDGRALAATFRGVWHALVGGHHPVEP